MTDQDKTAEEVVKTVGKAIDASRAVGGFIAKYINSPLEQAMGIVEDRLKYLRWERAIRLGQRADEFLKSQGLSAPSRPIPMKIAIPIMVEGSLEEDDKLQDIWAQLLANAADKDSGVEIRHMFLSILKDLTSQDVTVLRRIYAIAEDDAKFGLWTGYLPDRIVIHKDIEQEDIVQAAPTPEIQLTLSNLFRLGLITLSSTWGGSQTFDFILRTVLGCEFVKACSTRRNY